MVDDSPRTEFFCVSKKQGDGFGREEDVVWGILKDDAMFIMELEIFEPELHSASVECRLCVFTRALVEEE